MPTNQSANKQFIETGVASDLSTSILADLVDAPGSKEAFWVLVEKIMDHLINHPNIEVRNAMKQLKVEAKNELDGTFNNWGANKKMEFRKVMLLPDKLVMALVRVYGSSLPVTQKEFQKGMWKRYPALRTSHQY